MAYAMTQAPLTIYEGAAGFRGLGLVPPQVTPSNPHTDLGPTPEEVNGSNPVFSDEVKIGIAGVLALGLFAVWWTTRDG